MLPNKIKTRRIGMFNIAICDDEKYYRDYIKELVIKYFDAMQLDYHLEIFESGTDLCMVGLEKAEYDIVFLDINMKEMDGIETAKQIRKINSNAFIVFITAFVSFSPEGYKVDAIRYILKDSQNFEAAITECLDTIFGKMAINRIKMKFDFIEGEKEILLDDIILIESRLHKLVFEMSGKTIKKYTLYGKLDEIEILLEPYGFLRLHQRFLVNIKYIIQVNNYRALLTTSKYLSIPKLKFKAIKEAFIEYKGDL